MHVPETLSLNMMLCKPVDTNETTDQTEYQEPSSRESTGIDSEVEGGYITLRHTDQARNNLQTDGAAALASCHFRGLSKGALPPRHVQKSDRSVG